MKKKVNFISKKLFKNGYCIVDNFLSKSNCEKLKKKINYLNKNKVLDINNKDAKNGQVILRDLVLRDPRSFLNLIDKKLIMGVLDSVFKDKFILENIMGSNSVNVKKNYSRIIHIDSHLPTSDPKNTSDIVVLFCLDDFTKYNGATKVWPGSHLSNKRIHHETHFLTKKNIKNFKYVEAKKGSIVFFLGQTWHMIGQNINSKSRWGILTHYKRWWIKPSTDFTKCGSKIFKLLNNKQKELFGFTSIPPKFNLKSMSRNGKTLRKVFKVNKNYLKALNY